VEAQVAAGDRLRDLLTRAGWRVENRTPLPVVCFVEPALDDAGHRAVAAHVCASGEAWLAAPRWRGRAVLRAAVLSDATTDGDLDALVAALESAREALRGN